MYSTSEFKQVHDAAKNFLENVSVKASSLVNFDLVRGIKIELH